MCLLFFLVNNNAGPNEYKLVLVNNRDEFYSRPTEIARVWDTNPKVIAGKDGELGREGGIWLGASDNGKIGCLLNMLQPGGNVRTDVSGRGFLALEFLKNSSTALDYIKELKKSSVEYNLFNLILFEMKDNKLEAMYYNSVDNDVCPLESDKVHGFGNCLLSRPFIKVEKGKEMLHKIISKYGTKDYKNNLIESLFEMMKAQEEFFPDEHLIRLGQRHKEEHLRALSSIWVTMPEANYGTRTTTIITVDGSNRLSYYESTMEKPSASCEAFCKSEFAMEVKST